MSEPRHDAVGFWRRLITDPKHGPLPGLLLVMTTTTGIVDAVSILSLGRVFVANMTGNVVFIGFALVGTKGFSLAASLSALGGFLIGAFGGGLILARLGKNRAVLVRNAVAIEFVLFFIALVLAISAGRSIGATPADAVALLLATALGLQNSVVRRLGVPDLTTTVLTMTLTGIAADVHGKDRAGAGRRIFAVLTMLLGAAGGALLVLHVSPSAALGVAAVLMALVLIAATVTARTPADWHA